MTLEELDYFRVTVNVQNITKAAEKLYISQPALSRIISRLEAEIGAPLFDRVGKNMIINDNGRLLYEFANKQHYAYTDLLNELSDVNEGISGSLSLAIHGMEFIIASQEVMNIIREYPNIKVRYSSVSALDLANGLLDTTYDVGITTKPIQNNAIYWHELSKDYYGILLSPDHPLSKKEILEPADIENEKFILIDAGSGGAERIGEMCESMGFEAKVHYQIDDVMLARDLIAAKNGIAFETYRQFMVSEDMRPKDEPEGRTSEKLVFRLLNPAVSEITYSIGILKDRRQQRPVRLLYERVCSAESQYRAKLRG